MNPVPLRIDFTCMGYKAAQKCFLIATHSAINITSAFANETGLTVEKRILFQLALFAIAVSYAIILTRTLPKSGRANRAGRNR